MNALEEIPEDFDEEEAANFLEELDTSVYHMEELESICTL